MLNKFQFFVMKIIALTLQMLRTSLTMATPNASQCKDALSQKLFFLLSLKMNLTALTLLSKVPPCTNILVQPGFFLQFNHIKADSRLTPTFNQYLARELGPLKFTSPIKGHFTHFLRTNTTFSRVKTEDQN